MGNMKSSSMATAAAVGLMAALIPATATAKVIELGVPSTALVAPSCPANLPATACTIVLTESTALETIRDSVAYPTTVKKAGMIVAFTIGLSKLDSNRKKALAAIKYLDSHYGGTTRAAIAVLKPTGSKRQRKWTLAAQSPVIHLQPYLGQVVQFPLPTALPVKPGYVVALSVPTWAPVLTFGLAGTKFAYRQSRATNCANAAVTEQAQMVLGSTAQYLCNYPGTRVEYSATEITNPDPTKNYVHAPDIPARASSAAVRGAVSGGAPLG
jgi:hypothetical protein